MSQHLEESTPLREGPLLASKWQQQRIFIDPSEMEALLDTVGNTCTIYPVSGRIAKEKREFSHGDFLAAYSEYIRALQKGNIPEPSTYRDAFSSAWSLVPDALYATPIDNEHLLIRPRRPVVQTQVHRMHYSAHDKTMRSMIFGPDAVLWGVQFSYPHLYQNAETKETFRTTDRNTFPNTRLWQQIQRWIRHETFPVTFQIGEDRIRTSLRLGKKCRDWIQCHPQLKKNRWEVAC